MEDTNTTSINPPPSAGASAAIAMFNDLDSDEDSQVGAAINLRVNMVSINQNLAQDEGENDAPELEESEISSGLDLNTVQFNDEEDVSAAGNVAESFKELDEDNCEHVYQKLSL